MNKDFPDTENQGGSPEWQEYYGYFDYDDDYDDWDDLLSEADE